MLLTPILATCNSNLRQVAVLSFGIREPTLWLRRLAPVPSRMRSLRHLRAPISPVATHTLATPRHRCTQEPRYGIGTKILTSDPHRHGRRVHGRGRDLLPPGTLRHRHRTLRGHRRLAHCRRRHVDARLRIPVACGTQAGPGCRHLCLSQGRVRQLSRLRRRLRLLGRDLPRQHHLFHPHRLHHRQAPAGLRRGQYPDLGTRLVGHPLGGSLHGPAGDQGGRLHQYGGDRRQDRSHRPVHPGRRLSPSSTTSSPRASGAAAPTMPPRSSTRSAGPCW